MPQLAPVLVIIHIRLEWVNHYDPQKASYADLFHVIRALKIANSDPESPEQEGPSQQGDQL